MCGLYICLFIYLFVFTYCDAMRCDEGGVVTNSVWFVVVHEYEILAK